MTEAPFLEDRVPEVLEDRDEWEEEMAQVEELPVAQAEEEEDKHT